VFPFAVQVLKRPLLVLPARFGPITAEEGDVDIDLKDRLGRLGLCACVTLTLFVSSSQNYSPTGIPEQISIVALRRCRRDPRAGKPCAVSAQLYLRPTHPSLFVGEISERFWHARTLKASY
jgi:hypothetical protein